jgi:repressor LexA
MENSVPKKISGKRGRKKVEGLTPTQKKVLKTIQTFMDKEGMAPTVTELGEILGTKGASVHEQLVNLERKGFIRRKPRKARSLEIIRSLDTNPPNLVSIPLIGEVSAGRPILAVENVIGEILMDSSIARGPCFALAVKGDSMVEANINEGDYLIVRQQPLAENGDIVVALLGEEATVKRLMISNEQIILRPENSNYQDILLGPADQIQILGKVVAIRGKSSIV